MAKHTLPVLTTMQTLQASISYLLHEAVCSRNGSFSTKVALGYSLEGEKGLGHWLSREKALGERR